MSIRSRMIHRATVTRNVGTTEDPYGAHVPSIEQVHEALPCYIQPRTERTVTGEGKFIAVTMLDIWAARDADLANEDIITQIVNLAGNALFDGKRRVTALVNRETHKSGFLEGYA